MTPSRPEQTPPWFLLHEDSRRREIRRSSPPVVEPAPPGNLPVLPGYEIQAEIGRGTHGIVYRARQPGLDRLVAIKLLPRQPGSDPREATRFRREAVLLARLRHPHLVSIYEAGTTEDCVYLVLEYVDGGTLAEQITRREYSPEDAAFLVERIAQAVACAHQEGILHRDIKPANVLLTPEGEPRVADFGLARTTLAEGHLTATGAPVGSPAYMAPEVLGGASATPASDVYSLGVLLYEILTGSLPFPGRSPGELYLQILVNEPASPRAWKPAISRDLETICLKCLRLDPATRYPSARELAEDLRRYREGQPIRARPLGWVQRRWAWCRRNPMVAALCAVILLLVGGGMMGLVTAARSLSHKNAELEQANQALTRLNEDLAIARHRAESSADLLRRSLHQTTSQLIEHPILKEIDSLDLRRDLLVDVLPIFDRLAALEPVTDKMARERADSLHKLAYYRHLLGDLEASAQDIDRAIAAWTELERRDPADTQARFELALTLCEAALIEKDRGNLPRGEEYLGKSLTLLAELPADSTVRLTLAVQKQRLARLILARGEAAQALAHLRQGQTHLEEILKGDPANLPARRTLAELHSDVAGALRTEDPPAALTAMRSALDLRETLFQETEDREDCICLARLQIRAGELLVAARDAQTAEKTLRNACRLLAHLVEIYPSFLSFRRDLASGHNNLGNVLELRRQYEASLAEHLQARQIRQRLVEQFPNTPRFTTDLAMSCLNLVQLYHRLQKQQEAKHECDLGIELLQRGQATAPQNGALRNLLQRFLAVRLELAEIEKDWKTHAQTLNLLAGLLSEPQRTQLEVLRSLSLARAGEITQAQELADSLFAQLPKPLALSVARTYALVSDSLPPDSPRKREAVQRGQALMRTAGISAEQWTQDPELRKLPMALESKED